MGEPGDEHLSVQPTRLQRGRDFERRVKTRAQDTRRHYEGGTVLHEEVILIDGRRRRVDLMMELDDDGNELHAVLLEIKSSDWDTMRPDRIRRNMVRHASQVLNYVWGCVNVRGWNATPGILYEFSPSDPRLKDEIAHYHDSRGVQVVWADDPDQHWL